MSTTMRRTFSAAHRLPVVGVLTLALGAPLAARQPASPSADVAAPEQPRPAEAAAPETPLPPDLLALEDALREDPDDLRLGAEYRQAVIAAGAYDHAIAVLGELAEANPESANIRLNLGFAHVDKIPTMGAVNQSLLSHAAIQAFGEAIELEDSWLARYSRGAAYVYWPAVFEYAPRAIEDLERAIALVGDGPEQPYQVRHWIALGDAWWRAGDLQKSREVWRRGLELHPGDPELEARLAAPDDEALVALLESRYELGRRIDTSLQELWRR